MKNYAVLLAIVLVLLWCGALFMASMAQHQAESVNDLKATVAEQEAEIADLKARTSTHVKTKIQDRHPDMKEN